MILSRTLFVSILMLFVTHNYINAHGAPDKAYSSYQQPAYDPYAGASAPPLYEDSQPTPPQEKHVYVKKKVIEKVIVVEKDEHVKNAAELLKAVCHFYTILNSADPSKRATFSCLAGSIIFIVSSVIWGNDLLSKATGCAALGSTLIGGTAGLGYTALYGTPKKPTPKVMVKIETTYTN